MSWRWLLGIAMLTQLRMLGIVGTAALATSAIGCPTLSATVTHYCNSRSDCTAGESCSDGICVPRTADSGNGDAATSGDRSLADAARVDAAGDAHLADAAHIDAGDASICIPEHCPASAVPCQQATCDDSGHCSYHQADDHSRCAQGICIGGSCEPRCWIAGGVVLAGASDPNNVCRWCDPVRDPFAYVDHPAAACDDGAWCTGADSCSGGTCTTHEFTGNERCNGGQRPACDEAMNRCVCTTTSCPSGHDCNTGTNRCHGALTIALSNGNQDGFQDPASNNTVLLAYSWMSLYSTDHVGGLRFQIPAIPAGAVITDAHLTVYVDSATEGNASMAIQVENTANAPALLADAYNISSRTCIATTINWVATLPEGWADSPSLVSLVQAILAKAGWAAGNSILFKLVNTTGALEFRQYDHSAGEYGAKLIVDYELP